jgi:hypothetical protein
MREAVLLATMCGDRGGTRGEGARGGEEGRGGGGEAHISPQPGPQMQ